MRQPMLCRALTALIATGIVLAAVPRGTALANSTIDTAKPVQGVPYSAAPIRQNFVAAANDIEALQSMNAGATAPSSPVLGQLWLETPTGQTTYKLRVYDDRTTTWVIVAYFDSLNSLWIAPVGGGLPQTILTADTTDLGTYPNTVLTVTGAGPVYSFGASAPAGTIKVLTFAGATNIVYNATSMITPGAANINTAANDVIIAVALGSGNWQALFFQSATLSVAQGGTGRTSLTDHAVLLGSGTSPIDFAAPGTSGYPLLSTGAAADPAFGQLNLTVGVTGTLPVTNGGTGRATIAAHGLLLGNGTSAPTILTPGSSGLPLVSLGGSVDPAYGQINLTTAVTGALPVANGGTGLATIAAHGLIFGNGTSAPTILVPGTAGLPLVSLGAGVDPGYAALNVATSVTGVLPVANGGLGVANPTDHAILVGSGAGAVTPVGPGTIEYPLVSTGAGTDPAFQQLNLAGAGVTGVLPQANFTMTPTFTTLTTTGAATIGTNLGVNVDLAVGGNAAITGSLTVSANITAAFLPTVAAGTGKGFVCVDTVTGSFFRGTGASCN